MSQLPHDDKWGTVETIFAEYRELGQSDAWLYERIVEQSRSIPSHALQKPELNSATIAGTDPHVGPLLDNDYHGAYSTAPRECRDCSPLSGCPTPDTCLAIQAAYKAKYPVSAPSTTPQKSERVPICGTKGGTVSRAIWDEAWIAYAKKYGGSESQHKRLLNEGFYDSELDELRPGWRPVDQRITDLERELADANKRAHYEATWHNHYAIKEQTMPSAIALNATLPPKVEAKLREIKRILAIAFGNRKDGPIILAGSEQGYTHLYTTDHLLADLREILGANNTTDGGKQTP